MPSGPQWNSVGPRVASLLEHLVGLDDLVDFCVGGIGFRINDIDARRAVAGEWRQRRRAGVPTEMMELVALVGHRHRVNDLAKCGRAGLHVDHRKARRALRSPG